MESNGSRRAAFKKAVFRIMVAALATSAALLASAAQAQTTVLRYSNWLPAGQIMRVQVIEPWLAEVEKVTSGRAKIETLPKVVGSVAGQFDVARDGQADIVIFVPGYTPGRFALSEVVELPFMSEDPELYAPLVHRFYRKHLEQFDEYKGVHILSLTVNTPGQFMTKRGIRTMADFKGLRLRSPTASLSQSLTLLGVTPVSKPASELYELVSGGVLDGTLIQPEGAQAQKLLDLLPNLTILPGALYNTIMAIGINEEKWKSLRKEDQDAITRISGETLARKSGLTWKRGDLAAIDTMRKTGKSVEVLNPQLVAQIQETVKPVEQAWIEKSRKKGVPAPEKLIEALRAEIAMAKAGR